MPYTQTEQEIIVLNAVWDLIDDMVNYEIFVKPSRTNDVMFMPNTSTHARLFNILLLEFLTGPDPGSFDLPRAPDGSPELDRSYLYYLRYIYEHPVLGKASDLQQPVEALAQWLPAECTVENVWFPSIDVSTDLKMPRLWFIKICGNISKHSFARLSHDSKLIAKILDRNGIKIDDEQRFLVIPDFYEWFHRDIFSYHTSAIAEHLNNIRWGIFNYLNSEWLRSYRRDSADPIQYRYSYPPDCARQLPKSMYWDLMNRVRARPYMPRYHVEEALKKFY